MNNKTIIIGIALSLLLIAACSTKKYVEPQQPSGQEQATEQSIDTLDSDMAEVDKLSQDLDTEELDTLDEELNDVENADI